MFLTRKTLSTFSPAVAKRFGSTLVIADHNNKVLNAATLSSITAAKKFGSVHVLVAGSDCAAVATEVSKAAGVDGVIVADKPSLANFLPENLTSVLKDVITAGKYTHVVGATTSAIKSVIPRLAVAMNVSPITDVIGIKVGSAALFLCLASPHARIQGEDTFVRPIYAGNALSTVKSSDAIKLITIRPTNFEKVHRPRVLNPSVPNSSTFPAPLLLRSPLPEAPLRSPHLLPPPPMQTCHHLCRQRCRRATALSSRARASSSQEVAG
jgi:electron transfer flavoprotein alpha subunit